MTSPSRSSALRGAALLLVLSAAAAALAQQEAPVSVRVSGPDAGRPLLQAARGAELVRVSVLPDGRRARAQGARRGERPMALRRVDPEAGEDGSAHPETLVVRFGGAGALGGRELELRRDVSMFSPTYRVLHTGADGRVVRREAGATQCHYRAGGGAGGGAGGAGGAATASLSTCSGSLSGVVRAADGSLWAVEPAAAHVSREEAAAREAVAGAARSGEELRAAGLHVVFPWTPDAATLGAVEDAVKSKAEQVEEERREARAAARAAGGRTVRAQSASECDPAGGHSPVRTLEVALFSDKLRYDIEGSSTESTAAALFATVRTFYEDIGGTSMHCDLSLRLAGQVVFSSGTPAAMTYRACNTVDPLFQGTEPMSSTCCSTSNIFRDCPSGTTVCYDTDGISISAAMAPGCFYKWNKGWASSGDRRREVVVAYDVDSTLASEIDTDSLLESFAEYTLVTMRSHYESELGSEYDNAHLLTRSDFAASTVGLAYLGVMCTDISAGISMTPYSAGVNSIIVAHEMGHNFGMDHDSSGSGFIMQPGLNGLETAFSSTSWSHMNTFLTSKYGVSTSRCMDPCETANFGCSHTCEGGVTGAASCSCPGGMSLLGDGKTCSSDACSGHSCEHACATVDGEAVCTCPSGYELNGDGETCGDVNECASGNGGCQHVCTNTAGGHTCSCNDGFSGSVTCTNINECASGNGGCEQTCVDTSGSFHCTCGSGYTLNGDGESCDDVDECASNNGGCQHVCTNTEGGRTCSCNDGFSGSVSCTDINECASGNGGCEQTCTNTVGGHTCSCGSGYTLNGDGESCDDINECATDNGGCAQTCANTAGGRTCSCGQGFTLAGDGTSCSNDDVCAESNGGCAQVCNGVDGDVVCSCNAGYTLNGDGATCDDVNECLTANGGCSHGCTNTVGGRTCSCPSGFTLNGDGATCDDIDECATDNGGCSHTCANIAGSRLCVCPDAFTLSGDGVTCSPDDVCGEERGGCSQVCSAHPETNAVVCSCNAGYTLDADGVTCDDVDECAEENGGCSHFCFNSDGGHACGCPAPALSLGSDGRTCEDVDECAEENGGCAQTCHNTEGAHFCSCGAGYALGEDGRSCVDANECESANGGCSHECVNYPAGSHTCGCPEGLVLGGDGRTCEDVDECAEENGGCAQACVNTFGGHSCACGEGYALSAADGVTCEDVDECADGALGGCSHECVNAPAGSHTCACPAGYALGGDGRTCEDVDECAAENGGCAQACENTDGSFACACGDGFVLQADGVSCAPEDVCARPANGGCAQVCGASGGEAVCSCVAGYRLGADLRSCADVDECAEGGGARGNCSHTCTNTAGSFECSCPAGFTLSAEDGVTCEDVDECASGANGGCAGACVNEPGGRRCECPAGFVPSGAENTSCSDVDECATENGGCSHECENRAGSFECVCPPGYALLEDERTCVDVDECDAGVTDGDACSPLAACENTDGSFTCTCGEGYAGDALGVDGCADVDECALGLDDCDRDAGVCTNEAGSFSCACAAGFLGDGRSCALDCANAPAAVCAGLFREPCEAGTAAGECGACLGGRVPGGGEDGACVEVSGCASVTCFGGGPCSDMPRGDFPFTCPACPDGFSSTDNGVTCADTDGCAGVRCHGGATCVDVPAPDDGFRCPACPEGMETPDGGVTCTDVDGCAGVTCHGGAACEDVAAPGEGFSCPTCPEGTASEDGGLTCVDACVLANCTSPGGVCTRSEFAGEPARCSCRDGFSGVQCAVAPELTVWRLRVPDGLGSHTDVLGNATAAPNTSFAVLGASDTVEVDWEATAAVDLVSVQLLRRSTCAAGAAACVPEATAAAGYAAALGRLTWTVPGVSALEPGEDYFLRVWFRASLWSDSPQFAVRGPCAAAGASCANNGTCGGDGLCTGCAGFFGGALCEEDGDPCASFSCGGGECVADAATGAASCNCTADGSSGARCEVPAGCTLSCGVGGQASPACSSCQCNVFYDAGAARPRWRGARCEECELTSTRACGPHGEADAACASCECESGWTGEYCSVRHATLRVRLGLDYSLVRSGAAALRRAAELARQLVRDLAAATGEREERFVVTGLEEGSIVATVHVLDDQPLSDDRGANETAAAVDAMVADPDSALFDQPLTSAAMAPVVTPPGDGDDDDDDGGGGGGGGDDDDDDDDSDRGSGSSSGGGSSSGVVIGAVVGVSVVVIAAVSALFVVRRQRIAEHERLCQRGHLEGLSNMRGTSSSTNMVEMRSPVEGAAAAGGNAAESPYFQTAPLHGGTSADWLSSDAVSAAEQSRQARNSIIVMDAGVEETPAALEPRLPPGWVKYANDDGTPYYYNADTNESVWELPQF